MNTLIIVFVVVTLAVMFLFTYGKRVQMDRLAILLDCKDYEEFDKVVDSFLSRLLVKHYDLESVKLNSYIARNDKANIDKQFDLLSKVAKGKIKQTNIAVRGFEHYVYDYNAEKARFYLDKLKEIGESYITSFCEREYDILINKSKDHIEELEKEINESSGQKKTVLTYLLKLSYENACMTKKARELEKH